MTVCDGGRTVTVTEPEFDAWERALQTAYDDYSASLCPNCGQPLAESLWSANANSRPTYQAGFTECRACEVLEITVNKQAQTDAQQSEQNGFPVSTHHRQWRVERVDRQS